MHDFRPMPTTHGQDVSRTTVFAENTGVVSAVLKNIPNQPTKFVDADPLEDTVSL